MANSSNLFGIDVLNRLLDKGDVNPLCEGCCPCGDVYVFASVETYLKFYEGMNWGTWIDDCPNGRSFQLNCCTEDCLEKLGVWAGPDIVDVILDKGFVEFSQLGGKSMLCTLYDYLVQENITGQDAIDIVSDVLDKGVVYYCNIDKNLNNGDQSQSVLASVETFLKYIEAVGGVCTTDPPPSDPCQCLPEPCCFNIKATVETYLKYAEAVG